MAAEQLVFPLPHREALGRDDFLVAASNEAAVALVDQWPEWPTHAAILLGPAGAGKSHLAKVWQAKSAGQVVSQLSAADVGSAMAHKALCLEDVQRGSFDQTALFHALNLAKQVGGYVLLTTRFPIQDWGVSLPDLKSRLLALPIVNILPPDDALLRGVLAKMFQDRQIAVDEGLLSFMLQRMPRSLAAAREIVTVIDRKALAEKAEVTKVFVGKVLQSFAEQDLFTP